MYGYIDIARMLVGEYSARVDIQNTVRPILRSLLSDDVGACVKWLCPYVLGMSSLSWILTHTWLLYL